MSNVHYSVVLSLLLLFVFKNLNYSVSVQISNNPLCELEIITSGNPVCRPATWISDFRLYLAAFPLRPT